MTEKRQILDVTYGTFSCRLEGFDDSIGTLKKVADYFHQLAEDAPDHDNHPGEETMTALAALTREVTTREVEVSEQAGKLHLRQRISQVLAATEPDMAQDDDSDDHPVAAELAQDDAVEDAGDDNETVAEKMQRIRDVVGQQTADKDADKDDADFTEDLIDTGPVISKTLVNPLAQRLAALAERNAAALAAADGDDAEPDHDGTPSQADLDDLAALDGTSLDADLNLATLVQDDDLNLQDEMADIERDIHDRNKRHDLIRASDAAVSRIMHETDSHLNAPELRRQHDSFAQLKAAAVATEAARQLGDDGGIKQRLSEIFRQDLGAIAPEDQTRWSISDEEEDDTAVAPVALAPQPHLPPLRLVASQRIILSQPSESPASARLRQIAQKVGGNTAQPASFAEFAKSHDATSMDDLFEAAAAYVVRVKKQDSFSRPQLMGMVRSTYAGDFSRKAGLQSFAAALREKRIVQRADGRFSIADTTRFQADEQAARG